MASPGHNELMIPYGINTPQWVDNVPMYLFRMASCWWISPTWVTATSTTASSWNVSMRRPRWSTCWSVSLRETSSHNRLVKPHRPEHRLCWQSYSILMLLMPWFLVPDYVGQDILAADAPSSCCHRSSTAMILTMWNEDVLSCEWILNSTFRCWGMIWSGNLYSYFLKEIQPLHHTGYSGL